MNKTEMISKVRKNTGISKNEVCSVLHAFIDILSENLQAGGSLSLPGLGTFSSRQRGQRTGRNPHTGEMVTIPPRVYPSFKASPILRKKVLGVEPN